MSPAPVLRAGQDADAGGFIALIEACWSEYPGCVMDLDGEVPELRALASYYAGKGGALWVAEAAGRVVGMVATAPLEDGAWEICKMYAASEQRGGGLAQTLLAAAEAHARAAGAARLKLWSDTRFERAHRFYEKHSYVRAGALRALDDKSHSIEFAYAKPASGGQVERLDAAAAASAETRLAAVLCRCVEAGASVSFKAPLAVDTARAYWRRVSREVATGQRVLLAAWLDGVLSGTVMLDIGMPSNQPHRAEVKKLLVLPAARRRGVGRALMAQVEREAAAAGRHLLTLDTRAGDAAEPLYRAMGWHEAGRVPGYVVNADGTPGDAIFFYRRV